MKLSILFKPMTAVLLGIVMGVGITPAFAVDGDPPGLFELDGNPVDDPIGLPDDWEALHDCWNNGGCGPMPIEFTGIIPDPAPLSIFTTGGSKDINDIDSWKHKDGSVPDKDDITNAYAAAYLVPDDVCLDEDENPVWCDDPTAVPGPVHHQNDMIIYFGLDRYDNSGDAFAGFWFLQNDVTENFETGGFDGVHQARNEAFRGDLLVLVEYPQGENASPVIKIYEWDPFDFDGNGNLDEDGKSLGPLDMIYGNEHAECDGKGNKLACAITNDTDIAGPTWDYTPKDGGDMFPYETFYSGGINVTKLLSGTSPCISTFLAETRSSRSESAQLKDYALGRFDLCAIDATKSCEATLNAEGDTVTVTFDGSVTNDGAIALDVELYDSISTSTINAVCFDNDANEQCGDPTDTLPDNLVSGANAQFTLQPGDVVWYEGSYTESGPITDLDFEDTITAEAWAEDYFSYIDGYQVAMDDDLAQCFTTGTPDIFVEKNCEAFLDNGDTFRAEITGYVQNVGNVKLVNVTLVDTTFTAAELAPGFDGELNPGEVLPFSATLTSTEVTEHENTLTVTGANVFDATDTVNASDVASCGLLLNPDLSITKVCDTENIPPTGVQLTQYGSNPTVVAVEVGSIVTVTNEGDEVLNPVVVTDTEAVLVPQPPATGWTCDETGCVGALALGESVDFIQTYMPDGVNIVGALTNPGSVEFVNTATASGAGVLSTIPVGPFSATAQCSICPACECE